MKEEQIQEIANDVQSLLQKEQINIPITEAIINFNSLEELELFLSDMKYVSSNTFSLKEQLIDTITNQEELLILNRELFVLNKLATIKKYVTTKEGFHQANLKKVITLQKKNLKTDELGIVIGVDVSSMTIEEFNIYLEFYNKVFNINQNETL